MPTPPNIKDITLLNLLPPGTTKPLSSTLNTGENMPNTNPLSQTQFLQQATSLGLTPTQANDLWEAISKGDPIFVTYDILLPADTPEDLATTDEEAQELGYENLDDLETDLADQPFEYEIDETDIPELVKFWQRYTEASQP